MCQPRQALHELAQVRDTTTKVGSRWQKERSRARITKEVRSRSRTECTQVLLTRERGTDDIPLATKPSRKIQANEGRVMKPDRKGEFFPPNHHTCQLRDRRLLRGPTGVTLGTWRRKLHLQKKKKLRNPKTDAGANSWAQLRETGGPEAGSRCSTPQRPERGRNSIKLPGTLGAVSQATSAVPCTISIVKSKQHNVHGGTTGATSAAVTVRRPLPLVASSKQPENASVLGGRSVHSSHPDSEVTGDAVESRDLYQSGGGARPLAGRRSRTSGQGPCRARAGCEAQGVEARAEKVNAPVVAAVQVGGRWVLNLTDVKRG